MIMKMDTSDKLKYNCYHYAISRILQSLKKDYQFVQLGSWGFQFDLMTAERECIGNAIGEVCRYNILKIIYKLCGVQTQYYNNENVTFKDIQWWLAAYGMVLAEGDLYYCSWSKAYQKSHINHYFIIAGIAKNKACIHCYDPYLYEGVIYEISINIIQKGIKGFTVFWTERGNNLSRCETISFLKEKIYQDMNEILDRKSRDSLYNIYYLKDALENQFSSERELGSVKEELYSIPIILKLKMVYYSRCGYIDFLRYYASLSTGSSLYESANLLIKSASLWQECRMLLLKPFVRKEIRGEPGTGSKLISQAALIEINCARNIIKNI